MFIPGAAGQLEVLLESDSANRDFAIIAHPHPQYGGSMSDNVVALLGKAFAGKGINTLKFNFRGVGSSESHYDGGEGEVDDLRSVIAWCTEHYPQARVYVCGYSFGAIMVLKALTNGVDGSVLRGLVLVAPPTQMLPRRPELPYPLLVIAGAQDEIVPLETALTAFGTSVQTIDGSDHFFNGADQQIIDFTQAFIDAT